MKDVKDMLEELYGKLVGVAKQNAVMAKPISVGDRHVVPICQLNLGFGGGGGSGHGSADPERSDTRNNGKPKGTGLGLGGGAGGGARVTPVAVVVIDQGKVRIDNFIR